MKVFDIIVDTSFSGYENTDVEHSLWAFLIFLHQTNQIINSDDYIFNRDKHSISVRVVCPEPNSLLLENTIAYVKDAKHKLETITQHPLRYQEVGAEPQYINYRVPENSSCYILRYGGFSPLLCGDTFKPIPLYRIPATHHDNKCYDNLCSWERNYKHLYGLWLSGSVCEAFAQKQLQDHHSKLSILGRELCQRIEDLTGKSTYYFLFNYRAWSKAQDLARKCPATGSKWLISGKTASDPIAFKCDTSRLVSELSANCR
jgi:predicted  nucleic acid-binding Zn ribbon protein